MIASHHPSPTLSMTTGRRRAEPRVLGEDVVTALLGRPQVIAWIAGHVHFHAALRHEKDGHAFVELTTASLIDWPQQGRILEFVRVARRSAEIAIVSTVVDHARRPHGRRALDDLHEPRVASPGRWPPTTIGCVRARCAG